MRLQQSHASVLRNAAEDILPSFSIKATAEGFLLSMTFRPVTAEEPSTVSLTLGLSAEVVVPDHFERAACTSRGQARSRSRIVLPGGFGICSQSAMPTGPGFGPRGGPLRPLVQGVS